MRRVLILSCLIFFCVLPVSGIALESEPPVKNGRLVNVEDSAVIVSWQIAKPEVVLDDGQYLASSIGDWPVYELADDLLVPYDAVLVALPPGVEPAVEIETSPRESLTALPDCLRESVDLSQEDHCIEVKELGVAAGVRLLSVRFEPVSMEGEWLQYARSSSVRISWDETALTMDRGPDWVVDSVVNPQHATVLHTMTIQGASIPQVGDDLYAHFYESGLYSVTGAQLAAQGWVDVDPRDISILDDDVPVSVLICDDGDAVFEDSEAILFYGAASHSRWTTDSTYRLSRATVGSPEMAVRPAIVRALPAGQLHYSKVLEQDLVYMPDCMCGALPTGHDGDVWAWKYLRVPDVPAFETTFELEYLVAGGAGMAKVWFVGGTSVLECPDHRVEIWINDVKVGTGEFDGKSFFEFQAEIEPGILVGGLNTLRVVLPGSGADVEACWLDAVELTYEGVPEMFKGQQFLIGEDSPGEYEVSMRPGGLLLDITDAHSPILLDCEASTETVSFSDDGFGQRRYLVADPAVQGALTLRQAEQLSDVSGDYVVITDKELWLAAERLAVWREAQGSQVVLVDIQSIYDTFGDGNADPAAIRAFLAKAYTTWPRPIEGVLLLGGGTNDPRHNATDIPDYVPVFLTDADPWVGETAADNQYVCVDGDDNIPDIAIGRLPAWSLQEADRMVNTIIAYEEGRSRAPWHGRVLLVSDDQDASADFAAMAEKSGAYLPQGVTTRRLELLGSSAACSDGGEAEAKAIRAALLEDWQEGVALVQYSGHASWQQWAVESLLHLERLPAVGSTGQVPVLLELTCFTGAFHRPEPTLDRELISTGRVVAVFAPSGLGVNTGHDQLAQGFVSTLYDQNRQHTLGEIANAARLQLVASGRHLELLDTCTLLGDPLLTPCTGPDSLPYACYAPTVLR